MYSNNLMAQKHFVVTCEVFGLYYLVVLEVVCSQSWKYDNLVAEIEKGTGFVDLIGKEFEAVRS